MHWLLFKFCCFLWTVHFSKVNCEFVIPDVKFEAFTPSGFEISIPDVSGIQIVGFHASVNKDLAAIEPGEHSDDVTKPVNGRYALTVKNAKLKKDDKIYYWLFVQHSNLGYRKKGEFLVSELVKPGSCERSASLVFGRETPCKNAVIFEDEFDNIDHQKWLLEHFIPGDPDNEFVAYQKHRCEIKNGRLVIKPYIQESDDIYAPLNLGDECTKDKNTNPELCSRDPPFTPPILSGRVTSKISFTYGTVEVKAKLPLGDWIYPEIFLELESDPSKKLYIAYATGNENLIIGSKDIGGKHLCGGLYTGGSKYRCKNMPTKSNGEAFSKNIHVFKVVWTPNDLTLFVDGQQYGYNNLKGFNGMAKLVLGLGVGGQTDFPDNSLSNNIKKPWENTVRENIIDFYDGKKQWQTTWNDGSLQVESVRIMSL